LFSKFGFGGIDGFEDVVRELLEDLASCIGRSFCLVAVEACRGLGGGGGFEVDGDGIDIESPDPLRNAVGFLGGGGAVLTLALAAFDGRWCAFSAFVSVLTRLGAGGLAGSSSDDKSIRFGTESAFVVWVALRGGSPGLWSG
jgi:hypothetical protein